MILLINPYIHDFAAYDMWMMPLGLLHIGSVLKRAGLEVKLIDLINHGSNENIKRKPTGDGKIPYEVIEKPEGLKNIPKKYKRYGMPLSAFMEEIKNLDPRIDAILVTSKMTYWYPGVKETIRILKSLFPETKVILGGTYAKLLPEHAKRFSGADIILSDNLEKSITKISEVVGTKIRIVEEYECYEMDLTLIQNVRFIPLLSSLGCPYRCTYCASHKLFPDFYLFNPHAVVEQIFTLSERFKCIDITIFDDAFLAQKERAKLILNLLISSGKKFRIHAPNALHARFIDLEMAELMRKSGFYTIRLGLESSNPSFQRSSGAKIFNDEFTSAVKNLHRAGFSPEEIGVYVMAGLPFQKKADVLETINFVIDSGAKPKLVEYSPVPGTPLFVEAKRCSPFNLKEPLFHNNSILPCQWDGFTPEDFQEIKSELQKNKEHDLNHNPKVTSVLN